MAPNEYDWLEFKVRPKKDGLHDSGFRYIQLTGATRNRETDQVTKTPLNQWSDVVTLYGIVNIDVEPDGTIRLFQRGGGLWKAAWGEDYFLSSAEFVSTTPEDDIKLIRIEHTFAERRIR